MSGKQRKLRQKRALDDEVEGDGPQDEVQQ
jgi:hypothetical protein